VSVDTRAFEPLRVLIGCEFSGTVRDSFLAAGHDAMSCDLLDTLTPGPHYRGDVRDILYDGWDLAIFHPPCTYLARSGLHWNNRVEGRSLLTEEALQFAKFLMDAPIPRIALENPIGKINSAIRKPDQIIQPFDFGHDASKSTCLWLKALPKLQATVRFIGRMVEWPRGSGKMVERWSNQNDAGQSTLGPSADRWAKRSITYPGIAAAMRTSWGSLSPI
jgi:hypothetical protein